MKKTLLYLILAAGLMGCAKEMVPASEENQTGKPMTFEINVQQTKAEKTLWADGDVIYVFFKGISDKYLALTYNGSGWDESCPAGDLLDTDFAGVSDYKLAAVHFPVAVDVSFDEGEFQFSLGGEVVHSYFMSESEKTYTVDGATVTATLSLAKPEKVVLFHIPGIQDNLSDYVFSCELVKSINCTGVSDATVLKMVSKISGGDLLGCPDADGAIFTALLTSLDAENYLFTLEGPDKTYTLIRKAKALEPGKMYEFPPLDDPEWTVEDNPGFINGYAYVEMGDGLKWATCNIGAENPWDYGDYYAWGETATKESYAWTNYIFAKDPSDYSNGVKKYSEEDSYKTLFPEDDAATSLWKDPWRMPTEGEWAVLRDATLYTWKWETNYNGSGKNGMLVTRKEGTGPCAGNSIFLPAAGRWFESQWLYGGSQGFYWSSSLDVTALFATGVEVLDSGFRWLTADRYAGLNVRPVTE